VHISGRGPQKYGTGIVKRAEAIRLANETVAQHDWETVLFVVKDGFQGGTPGSDYYVADRGLLYSRYLGATIIYCTDEARGRHSVPAYKRQEQRRTQCKVRNE